MALPYPSVQIFGRYYTRKDFHHKRKGYGWSYRNKKSTRKDAQSRLRNYKGDFGNGGWYKKVFDVPWTVF